MASALRPPSAGPRARRSPLAAPARALPRAHLQRQWLHATIRPSRRSGEPPWCTNTFVAPFTCRGNRAGGAAKRRGMAARAGAGRADMLSIGGYASSQACACATRAVEAHRDVAGDQRAVQGGERDQQLPVLNIQRPQRAAAGQRRQRQRQRTVRGANERQAGEPLVQVVFEEGPGKVLSAGSAVRSAARPGAAQRCRRRALGKAFAASAGDAHTVATNAAAQQ